MIDEVPNGPKRELAPPLFAICLAAAVMSVLMIAGIILLQGRELITQNDLDPQP